MRSILLFFALAVFLLTGCAASKAPVTSMTATAPKRAVATGQTMTVRTTAYTHTEPGGRNNAIGTRLRFGGTTYSAASDWSWMPLGTRFYMPCTGRTYVIEDYGSALVGRKTIDLYMPSRNLMNKWGLRHVDIEILEWGSRTMSLKLLVPRLQRGYWHVRTMVAELRKQGPPERG
jgi:3D (Asp-Asp-Asp) domain-containing protein